MKEATTTFTLDAYRFSWSEEGIEVLLDRLGEQRGDLICEMAVSTSRPFAGLLRQAKFNLSSTRTRTEWTKALSERQPDIDWFAIIEQVCTLALKRWREGSPVMDLALVEPSTDDPYLLPPYILDSPVASGLFGDGGTGKSMIALAAALSIATGEPILGVYPSRLCPVLYLDWEWDADAHAERLQALSRSAQIDAPPDSLWYRHEIASVIESAPNIRRIIAERGIGLVVVDSLGVARGGEPESADLTIRTFAAFRSFGTPTLFVDHVAKHATDKSHSFGSVFTRNCARLMWRVDTDIDNTTDDRRLGLVNTKWNRRFQRPRGLLLSIETDAANRLTSVRFDDCEPPLVTIRTSSLRDAALACLRQNPNGLSLDDLRTVMEADGVKVTKNVLSATLGKKVSRTLFYSSGGKWFAPPLPKLLVTE